MAAPMCQLCGSSSRDFYLLYGRKKNTDILSIITLNFPVIPHIEKVCRNCWRTLELFAVLKRSVDSNIHEASNKRAVTPGKCNTPKRKRTATVAEQIISSCEKRKSVIEVLMSSIEKLKLVTKRSDNISDPLVREKEAGPKKKLSFGPVDHTYSETTKKGTKVTQNASDINEEVRQKVVNEIQVAFKTMSSNQMSVLYQKSPDILSEEKLFEAAYSELELNMPFFIQLMEAIVGNTGHKRATIVMIYSMILNSRNNKVSGIQRIITVLAVKCHADNMLLSRLNKLHITMSAASKSNIIDECGDNCYNRLKKSIKEGNDGKLNGDNVDIFVTTNDVRMANKSKDYHFFATDFTPFRVTQEDFVKNEYLVQYLASERDQNVNIGRFQPDTSLFRENIKLLVARDLIKHLNLKWMELVVPKHIDNPLQEIMSRKTASFCLPILLKNEAKYEDCIQIMDAYEKQVERWYRECGRIDDFKNCMIPVGGDQLTRVRLDGAKNLRLGAHTPQERFDNLCPVIVEMFHTQMDFLEKTIKKFFKKSSGRDVGTLYHLKTLIQRTSVNGNVKSRFKAHEEFALLVGKAYVLEAAMEYFGMDDVDSIPTRNVPAKDLSRSHQSRRLGEFNKAMDGFLAMVCSSLSFTEVPDQNRVTVTIAGHDVQLPVENGNVNIRIQHLGKTVSVPIAVKILQQNSVKVMLGQTAVTITLKKADDLQNYLLNCLQYYFVLLNFKDSIREGDIFRISNILKMVLPFFFNHSALSKYMVECIDYILKTEILLPAKLSVQVRVASFVNPKGKQGKNKAADLQKENQVKEVKTLIRGLGANKTEQSIIKISEAAPVIKDIVQNLDSQIDFTEKTTSHKKRSEDEDLQCILKVLREIRPFRTVQGRKLESFIDMKASVFQELYNRTGLLNQKIIYTANRLKRGLPLPEETEGDE